MLTQLAQGAVEPSCDFGHSYCQSAPVVSPYTPPPMVQVRPVGTGASLKQLWKPVAVLVAVRLARGPALYVYQHVTKHFVVNNWDGGWYVYAAQHGWPHQVLTGLGNAGQ